MFENIGIPTEDEHLQQPLTQPYQRSTHRFFDVVKPLRGNIHSPSQCDHLEQFINAKEKDYKEILQESFSQSIIRK
jgi:hypothetical protein